MRLGNEWSNSDDSSADFKERIETLCLKIDPNLFLVLVIVVPVPTAIVNTCYLIHLIDIFALFCHMIHICCSPALMLNGRRDLNMHNTKIHLFNRIQLARYNECVSLFLL